MEQSSGTVRPTSIGRDHFTLVCLGLFVLIGIWLASLPGESVALLAVLAVCLTLGCISIFKPLVLLKFIVIVSASAGVLRTLGAFRFGKTEVTISGFQWVFIAGLAAGLFLLYRDSIEFPRWLYPFFIFLSWIVARWLLSGSLLGLKDVLFYGYPVLIFFLATISFAAAKHRELRSVETLILWTPLIAICMWAVMLPLGFVEFTESGPRGPLDPRALASYLLIVAALAAANWRYGRQVSTFKRGLLWVLIIFAILVFTQSRMAIIVFFLLLGISKVKPQRPVRSFIYLPLSLAMAIALFVAVPSIGSRFIGDSVLEFSDQFPFSTINTEGRDVFWAATAVHALESPWVGWGLGSSRLLVADVLSDPRFDEYPPHNEYLQVFHDAGMIGLVLMLFAWFFLFLKYWQSWKVSEGTRNWQAAKWDLTAILAISAILLTSVTGNELHYPFVTAPAFVLLVLRERYVRLPARPAVNVAAPKKQVPGKG